MVTVLLIMIIIGTYNLLWPLYGGAPLITQAFFIGLGIASVCTLPALWLVWQLDRREHESPLLLASAATWGAAVSASVSLVCSNTLYGYMIRLSKQWGGTILGMPADTFTSVFTSPIVEELVKGAAILVLFWFLRAEFDDLRDGMLYGAMVGLGFNAAQYTIFLLEEFAYSGTPPYLSLAALQFVFLGVNGHFIYSALLGAGFGLARETHDVRMRKLAPIAGIALAIVANMLANSVGTKVINETVRLWTGQRLLFASTPPIVVWVATALGTIASQFWAYVILWMGILKSERWEIETIRTQLANEVDISVTPEEYALVEKDAPFLGRNVPGYPKKVGRAIMRAQNELAYRKWHLQEQGGQVETDELVQGWRARVAQLRMNASSETTHGAA